MDTDTNTEVVIEGRPLKYDNAKDLKKAIDTYFDGCFTIEKKVKSIPYDIIKNKAVYRDEIIEQEVITEYPTVTGLCLALGVDRRTLINYCVRAVDKTDTRIPLEFFHTIKEAKAKIEHYIEIGALNGKINPTTAIFNLKNNFDRVDKIENAHSGAIDTGVIILPARRNSEGQKS